MGNISAACAPATAIPPKDAAPSPASRVAMSVLKGICLNVYEITYIALILTPLLVRISWVHSMVWGLGAPIGLGPVCTIFGLVLIGGILALGQIYFCIWSFYRSRH
jgi:hypothetical protein